MAQTIVEKIAMAYMTEGPSRELRSGDFVSIKPRHVLTHDNTSAVIKKFKSIGAKRVFNHQQPVFVLDHDIQNTSEANRQKYEAIRDIRTRAPYRFLSGGNGHWASGDDGARLRGAGIVRRGESIRTRICTARWARSARLLCEPTPRQYGRPGNSGGRFHGRCKWSSRAAGQG